MTQHTALQLPASSFQLPASSFQLPASSFQLPASSRIRKSGKKQSINKKTRIKVSLSSSEARQCELFAASKGMTISEAIRWSLQRSLG